MCGISGIINFNNQPAEESRIRKMMQVMKHRGPDDEGTYLHENVGLGFVRLSIIDLSPGGHQPMHDDEGRYTIVFNGEIYNYIELRSELKTLGFQFRSSSDTEVLLKAYIAWGKSCLNKLNGMFAFAVYDNMEKSLFIARDRYGIKPVYYYHDSQQLIFASEIPSILEVWNKKNTPNINAVYDYLTFNRTDHTRETFFEGIEKLHHGHYLMIENGKVEQHQWYNLRDKLVAEPMDATQYKELFASSVELRLRSDVPVGVCFSGGIDSSSVVSIISDQFGLKDINTFSAVYGDGKRGDESRFINLYQSRLKNMHFVYPSADSMFGDQLSFIRAHAEPFPTTAIYAQYKVMQLAQGKAKVLLDGQGADEQLAGYHYFFGYYFYQLVRQFRWLKLMVEWMHYTKNHRSVYALQILAAMFLPESVVNRRKQQFSAIGESFLKSHVPTESAVKDLINSKSLHESLLNHFEYKLEHLLKWEDRNSMWFSIESRVPFLDYRLVEATLSQPVDRFIHKGTTKAILRDAMEGIIPEQIRHRKDKTGFQTPEDEWFRTDKYRNYIRELLQSESFRSRGIINSQKALAYYDMHLNKKINISKEIWKWINLEVWYREYID